MLVGVARPGVSDWGISYTPVSLEVHMDLAIILFTAIASIILAFATAFFSSRFYSQQARADLKKEFESRFNERKWTTYTGFADTVRDVLEASKKGNVQKKLPDFAKKLMSFTSSLWLVGSDEVVKAYIDWQMYYRQFDDAESAREQPFEGLLNLTNILIEMRKDLGYENSNIGSVDLLKTFITDVPTQGVNGD